VTFLLVFLASGAVIVVAGSSLARQADAIATATGLGRVWIGSVLLAGATSLPELTTDVVAVRMGATDLALGDLFGSCMANMLILAVLDLVARPRGILKRVGLDHALVTCLAIGLNSLAVVLVLVRPQFSILSISPGPLLIFIGYLVGTRAGFLHARREGATSTPERVSSGARAEPSLARALRGFALAAGVVLLIAPGFAWSAKGLAEVSGLGNTFVGTALVGLATSLPELVTGLAAVRMGAFDLAVGNLFGSNALNMAILLPLDLAQPGSLFAQVDPGHALSGLFGVILMSLGLAAIVYRARRRFAMLEPDSLLMIVTYVCALWLLYLASNAA
jgi:cation:H+ antiporter